MDLGLNHSSKFYHQRIERQFWRGIVGLCKDHMINFKKEQKRLSTPLMFSSRLSNMISTHSMQKSRKGIT